MAHTSEGTDIGVIKSNGWISAEGAYNDQTLACRIFLQSNLLALSKRMKSEGSSRQFCHRNSQQNKRTCLYAIPRPHKSLPAAQKRLRRRTRQIPQCRSQRASDISIQLDNGFGRVACKKDLVRERGYHRRDRLDGSELGRSGKVLTDPNQNADRQCVI